MCRFFFHSVLLAGLLFSSQESDAVTLSTRRTLGGTTSNGPLRSKFAPRHHRAVVPPHSAKTMSRFKSRELYSPEVLAQLGAYDDVALLLHHNPTFGAGGPAGLDKDMDTSMAPSGGKSITTTTSNEGAAGGSASGSNGALGSGAGDLLMNANNEQLISPRARPTNYNSSNHNQDQHNNQNPTPGNSIMTQTAEMFLRLHEDLVLLFTCGINGRVKRLHHKSLLASRTMENRQSGPANNGPTDDDFDTILDNIVAAELAQQVDDPQLLANSLRLARRAEQRLRRCPQQRLHEYRVILKKSLENGIPKTDAEVQAYLRDARESWIAMGGTSTGGAYEDHVLGDEPPEVRAEHDFAQRFDVVDDYFAALGTNRPGSRPVTDGGVVAPGNAHASRQNHVPIITPRTNLSFIGGAADAVVELAEDAGLIGATAGGAAASGASNAVDYNANANATGAPASCTASFCERLNATCRNISGVNTSFNNYPEDDPNQSSLIRATKATSGSQPQSNATKHNLQFPMSTKELGELVDTGLLTSAKIIASPIQLSGLGNMLVSAQDKSKLFHWALILQFRTSTGIFSPVFTQEREDVEMKDPMVGESRYLLSQADVAKMLEEKRQEEGGSLRDELQTESVQPACSASISATGAGKEEHEHGDATTGVTSATTLPAVPVARSEELLQEPGTDESDNGLLDGEDAVLVTTEEISEKLRDLRIRSNSTCSTVATSTDYNCRSRSNSILLGQAQSGAAAMGSDEATFESASPPPVEPIPEHRELAGAPAPPKAFSTKMTEAKLKESKNEKEPLEQNEEQFNDDLNTTLPRSIEDFEQIEEEIISVRIEKLASGEVVVTRSPPHGCRKDTTVKKNADPRFSWQQSRIQREMEKKEEQEFLQRAEAFETDFLHYPQAKEVTPMEWLPPYLSRNLRYDGVRLDKKKFFTWFLQETKIAGYFKEPELPQEMPSCISSAAAIDALSFGEEEIEMDRLPDLIRQVAQQGNHDKSQGQGTNGSPHPQQQQQQRNKDTAPQSNGCYHMAHNSCQHLVYRFFRDVLQLASIGPKCYSPNCVASSPLEMFRARKRVCGCSGRDMDKTMQELITEQMPELFAPWDSCCSPDAPTTSVVAPYSPPTGAGRSREKKKLSARGRSVRNTAELRAPREEEEEPYDASGSDMAETSDEQISSAAADEDKDSDSASGETPFSSDDAQQQVDRPFSVPVPPEQHAQFDRENPQVAEFLAKNDKRPMKMQRTLSKSRMRAVRLANRKLREMRRERIQQTRRWNGTGSASRVMPQEYQRRRSCVQHTTIQHTPRCMIHCEPIARSTSPAILSASFGIPCSSATAGFEKDDEGRKRCNDLFEDFQLQVYEAYNEKKDPPLFMGKTPRNERGARLLY
ncbi:unnamed protein product [Amoebophrya sp. A120]|nr:unnamed protein product [Amoebophrya sp. A120]|eukprot:GSA120T00012846001.1